MDSSIPTNQLSSLSSSLQKLTGEDTGAWEKKFQASLTEEETIQAISDFRARLSFNVNEVLKVLNALPEQRARLVFLDFFMSNFLEQDAKEKILGCFEGPERQIAQAKIKGLKTYEELIAIATKTLAQKGDGLSIAPIFHVKLKQCGSDLKQIVANVQKTTDVVERSTLLESLRPTHAFQCADVGQILAVIPVEERLQFLDYFIFNLSEVKSKDKILAQFTGPSRDVAMGRLLNAKPFAEMKAQYENYPFEPAQPEQLPAAKGEIPENIVPAKTNDIREIETQFKTLTDDLARFKVLEVAKTKFAFDCSQLVTLLKSFDFEATRMQVLDHFANNFNEVKKKDQFYPLFSGSNQDLVKQKLEQAKTYIEAKEEAAKKYYASLPPLQYKPIKPYIAVGIKNMTANEMKAFEAKLKEAADDLAKCEIMDEARTKYAFDQNDIVQILKTLNREATKIHFLDFFTNCYARDMKDPEKAKIIAVFSDEDKEKVKAKLANTMKYQDAQKKAFEHPPNLQNFPPFKSDLPPIEVKIPTNVNYIDPQQHQMLTQKLQSAKDDIEKMQIMEEARGKLGFDCGDVCDFLKLIEPEAVRLHFLDYFLYNLEEVDHRIKILGVFSPEYQEFARSKLINAKTRHQRQNDTELEKLREIEKDWNENKDKIIIPPTQPKKTNNYQRHKTTLKGLKEKKTESDILNYVKTHVAKYSYQSEDMTDILNAIPGHLTRLKALDDLIHCFADVFRLSSIAFICFQGITNELANKKLSYVKVNVPIDPKDEQEGEDEEPYPIDGTYQAQNSYRERVYKVIQDIPRVAYTGGNENLVVNWDIPKFSPPEDILAKVELLTQKYPHCFTSIEFKCKKSGIDDSVAIRIVDLAARAITTKGITLDFSGSQITKKTLEHISNTPKLYEAAHSQLDIIIIGCDLEPSFVCESILKIANKTHQGNDRICVHFDEACYLILNENIKVKLIFPNRYDVRMKVDPIVSAKAFLNLLKSDIKFTFVYADFCVRNTPLELILDFIELIKKQNQMHTLEVFPNPHMTQEHYVKLAEAIPPESPLKIIHIWESSEYQMPPEQSPKVKIKTTKQMPNGQYIEVTEQVPAMFTPFKTMDLDHKQKEDVQGEFLSRFPNCPNIYKHYH